MSDLKLLKKLRPNGRWSEEARQVYALRRLLAFFDKHPVLIEVMLNNPDNCVLWNGIFRFFFRKFPSQYDTYMEFGEEKKRPWYYQEEVFDPLWDRLFREYQVGVLYRQLVRPYYKNLKG